MESLWNDQDAKEYLKDPLKLRVYTSRLLGQNSDLVLHGGGNTSVKAQAANLFGENEDILYVKGSGWDLTTIEAAGFAPVKMEVLTKMATLNALSDAAMVKNQRAAMIDPSAPNPSVEAILHSIIPFKFVDHTHADAVVTVTNTADGLKRIEDIYGNRVLVVPYIMPGFVLARKVYEMIQGIDLSQYEAMILMNHGVFTFSDDARVSYEQMIKTVTEAETYLKQQKAVLDVGNSPLVRENLSELASIRRDVSRIKGAAMLAGLMSQPQVVSFSNQVDVTSITTRGPLTPDHVIRTKRTPVVFGGDSAKDIQEFVAAYHAYFEQHSTEDMTCLDPAPRWAVWPEHGAITFGSTLKEVKIIQDITTHTMAAIQKAEKLGGWKALPAKDIFDIEYWELEQAKLKKVAARLPLQGKVAVVTGAASGIGKACVQRLHAQGAVVTALDINPDVLQMFSQQGIAGLVCDVTDEDGIKNSIEETVRRFGGLDIVVSNAGIFPASEFIARMKSEVWQKSLDINLSSHQILLKHAIEYLSLGIDPTVVIIASKNVPAPGPGASAYSVAKAGLTQLARVAALELGSTGIRVNVIHPNQVFDTAIWTSEVLENRAHHYGLSVEEYKTNNLLKVEINSCDVADLVCTMAGPVFFKTTGAQVAIDGGNERVI